jgi:acetyl esterase/lipase
LSIHRTFRLDGVNETAILSIMRANSRFLVLALAAVVTACSDDPSGPDDSTAGGVDLDVLFAAPTASEIATVEAQWAARTPAATDVQVELDSVIVVDSVDVRVRVVSHLVDGFRHVGAVIAADSLAGSAPVVVYTHGGDSGVRIEDVLFLFPVVGDEATDFVWVIPSFRSEGLEFAGETYTSQGSPSPWDRDVDDALSLLEVALDIEPAADADAIGLLGFSRGAGVALLMGARDPRIDRIVEFFGPTDFFDSWSRGLAADALRGQPADLPGLAYLDQSFLQPLARGEKTIAEVRLELVRRSSVLWAADLPTLQLHHGTADDIVDVSQGQSMISAMAAIGRGEPEFQGFLYDGGTHNPLTLAGSVTRTADFLRALLPTPLVQ